MREILFKAKRLNDGKWVEGNLFIDDKSENAEILVGYTNYRIPWAVDLETICQYTGLTDKNGNKIWENDICDRKEKFPEIVKMHQGDWTLDYSYAVGKENCYCNLGFYVCERKSVEVIGNIFDNPELLKGQQDTTKGGNEGDRNAI